jgi:hypothetical protein
MQQVTTYALPMPEHGHTWSFVVRFRISYITSAADLGCCASSSSRCMRFVFFDSICIYGLFHPISPVVVRRSFNFLIIIVIVPIPIVVDFEQPRGVSIFHHR